VERVNIVKDLPGKHWQETDGFHIDVSDLFPPEPMVAILGLLEQDGMEGPVIVHHDREPIYLYPELFERGWEYEILLQRPGKVVLKLTRI
jgi:hypothetical protein